MKLTIATRGSELALWQARHVQAALMAHDARVACELLIIKTTGDKILDVPLAEMGGKALFVKEIEQALLDGTAQVAVHSMKDVPAELAPGLMLAAITTREVPNDALLSHTPGGLAGLPHGALVGTASVRRQCQLAAVRPDLRFALLRGNVPTRVAKWQAGEYAAIVLAAAGLRRLGLAQHISELLPLEVALPAAGQGVLGIETRDDEPAVAQLVAAALHDAQQAPCTLAERSFLAAIGGSCRTPIGAYADYVGHEVRLRVMKGELSGKSHHTQVVGAALEAQALGQRAAAALAVM